MELKRLFQGMSMTISYFELWYRYLFQTVTKIYFNVWRVEQKHVCDKKLFLTVADVSNCNKNFFENV